jgi:S1-C subfamily serine protease
MRSLLLVLFALLCSCVSNPEPAAPAPPKATVAELRSASVALVTLKDDEYRAYCAGVWIGPHRILTAAHCVVDEIEVYFAVPQDTRGATYEIHDSHLARVAKIDTVLDLAVLDAAPTAHVHGVAPLAERVADGALVWTVGSPRGLPFVVSMGVVDGKRSVGGVEGEFLMVTSSAFFGSSGGPAFDEYGRVVGICSFIVPKLPMATFWVHPDAINRFAGNG